VGDLGDRWIAVVVELGGRADLVDDAAADLEQRYAGAGRHYHGPAHIAAVLRDIDLLADRMRLSPEERAVAIAAACAHDVVYEGRPGDDESASAAWARDALRTAQVPAATSRRVAQLILATADHQPPDRQTPDLAAHVLLDADLAILGSSAAGYAAYIAAVRAEYAHLSDDEWGKGRSEVLQGLLERDPLFLTAAGEAAWASAARQNMTEELASLS
jgi:predicted metal-dependent HD superfamily phosphohydrolase